MNTFDGTDEAVLVSPVGKKRRPSKEKHNREKMKKIRHSGVGKIPTVVCKHEARSCSFCHADELTPADIALNFNTFYSKSNKVEQDQAILHLITIEKVKRRRLCIENEVRRKDRDISVQYNLLTENHPRKLPVCKGTFLKVLGVSKDRVSRVAQYYTEHATSRPENRGGARRVADYGLKKQEIEDHVKTFTCRASHYGRRGAPGRKYLPNDLSVKKMHYLFKQQNHTDVSYSLYYSVFRYKFNLGFGSPASDACATCVKYRLRMKDPNMTDEEKQTETAMFILHRRRARVFYDLLGQVLDNSVTVCFDMMQNLVLPRTPIGQAYYSRQLYMYLFGIVVHHGKGSRQTKDDVYLYTWMEHENKKDSNMISSALDHCFRGTLSGSLQQANQLRLFSDSCFGQNKNINVLSMIFALRKNAFPNVTAEYIFPIRGHSFLPADRVFGRIEQAIRKHDTILMPEEYYRILRNYGNVYVYGQDWQAFDYKSATKAFVKTQRTFKISEARMLHLECDKVGFKTAYSGEYCYHSVLKRGKKWADFKPNQLQTQSTVSEAKTKDVKSLLLEMGASEEVFGFYNRALADTVSGENSENSSDEN